MGFFSSIKIVFTLLTTLVLVQLLNTLSNGLLSSFAIYPRSLEGLFGIPLAPLIHHNWWHLASNAIPFSILAFFTLQNGLKQFASVYLFITFIGGFSVWVLGQEGYHAGASLMVFGFWGYLIGLGFFQKSIKNCLIALIVLIIYGGLGLSLFAYQPDVSWSSHFFGLVSGVFAAKVLISNIDSPSHSN